MIKNLIPEIARLLGVEVGEEFEIVNLRVENDEEHTVRFTENSFQLYTENDGWVDIVRPIGGLIIGNFKIIKRPWKPKVGELFYSYVGDNWAIFKDRWLNVVDDLVFLKHGLVFKTEEEAIKKRPCLYKEYTGKDWSE